MKSAASHRFKKIYIEITNSCNMNCEFCKQTSRAKSFMSVAEFETIITKIKTHTDYVYLHVMGEPLLHPHLNEILNIAHENNINVNITTNGSLIKTQSETLLKSRAVRQVNFSLHNYSGYNDDVFEFAEIASKDKLIVLRLWNMGDKTQAVLREIESFFKLALPINIEVLHGNGLKIAHNLFVQLDTQFTWPELGLPQIFTSGKCYGLRHQVAILVDGTVVPCCLDSDGVMKLGNIFEDSLENIVLSDKAQNIRNSFMNYKVCEGFCKTCGFAVRLNSKIKQVSAFPLKL